MKRLFKPIGRASTSPAPCAADTTRAAGSSRTAAFTRGRSQSTSPKDAPRRSISSTCTGRRRNEQVVSELRCQPLRYAQLDTPYRAIREELLLGCKKRRGPAFQPRAMCICRRLAQERGERPFDAADLWLQRVFRYPV